LCNTERLRVYTRGPSCTARPCPSLCEIPLVANPGLLVDSLAVSRPDRQPGNAWQLGRGVPSRVGPRRRAGWGGVRVLDRSLMQSAAAVAHVAFSGLNPLFWLRFGFVGIFGVAGVRASGVHTVKKYILPFPEVPRTLVWDCLEVEFCTFRGIAKSTIHGFLHVPEPWFGISLGGETVLFWLLQL